MAKKNYCQFQKSFHYINRKKLPFINCNIFFDFVIQFFPVLKQIFICFMIQNRQVAFNHTYFYDMSSEISVISFNSCMCLNLINVVFTFYSIAVYNYEWRIAIDIVAISGCSDQKKFSIRNLTGIQVMITLPGPIILSFKKKFII